MAASEHGGAPASSPHAPPHTNTNAASSAAWAAAATDLVVIDAAAATVRTSTHGASPWSAPAAPLSTASQGAADSAAAPPPPRTCCRAGGGQHGAVVGRQHTHPTNAVLSGACRGSARAAGLPRARVGGGTPASMPRAAAPAIRLASRRRAPRVAAAARVGRWGAAATAAAAPGRGGVDPAAAAAAPVGVDGPGPRSGRAERDVRLGPPPPHTPAGCRRRAWTAAAGIDTVVATPCIGLPSPPHRVGGRVRPGRDRGKQIRCRGHRLSVDMDCILAVWKRVSRKGGTTSPSCSAETTQRPGRASK